MILKDLEIAIKELENSINRHTNIISIDLYALGVKINIIHKKLDQIKKLLKKGNYKMPRKAKLGSGKRFSALKNKIEKEGYSADSAKAIAAAAGRKKYGNKKMQAMAKAGKRRK